MNQTTRSPAAQLEPRRIAAASAARLERLPVGRWHARLTAIVGIGAFYEFFEVFLGSVLAAVLGPAWHLSTFETSSLIASVFVGMFVGATSLGRAGDRLGRRRMFLVNLSVYVVFAILAAFGTNVWWLIACRMCAGIGAGAETPLIPTYLGEFIPSRVRGRYIGYAFTAAFGAFPVVALAGSRLAKHHFLLDGWRWLLLLAASGVLFVLWMRRTMPESPRWLVSVGRYDEAETELARIERQVAQSTGRPLPEPEPLPADLPITTTRKVAIRDLFRREYVGGLIGVGAPYSIGVLAYYGFGSLAPVILAHKGFDIQKSLTFTAIMAVGYPVGALTAAYVAERFERRTIVVVSALLCTIAGLLFGYAVADGLILAAGFFMGWFSNIHSSAVNMYASEVFPTQLRSTAIGLCYGSGRIFAVLVPYLGLTILDAFGGGAVLLVSAIFFALTAALVQVFGPCTTGRVLEEVAG